MSFSVTWNHLNKEWFSLLRAIVIVLQKIGYLKGRNFDWNLILNGKYEFTYDGKELVISANKNDVGFYKYELTKE